MSKYKPLWKFLQVDGSEDIQFTFERIREILGFEIDHSFLIYKKEAEEYGYSIEHISMKNQWVEFKRINAGITHAIDD